MRKKNKKISKGTMGFLVSALLFLAMLIAMVFGTGTLGKSDEGLKATRSAVQRAAILCYATEGFYPPSLRYIEDNYLIKIDHSRFLVSYDVQGTNLMPTVQVFSR